MPSPIPYIALHGKGILIVLLGFIFQFTAHSQPTTTHPSWPIYLPEPTLFTSTGFERIDLIEQDGRGFLWLATNRGLFCFDGTFCRRVTHSPEGVSVVDNGKINDVFIDRERGNLWLATSEGVHLLDLKTETFTDFTFYQQGFPETDGECSTIMKDRQGNIWMGVMGIGLARYDSTFHFFPMEKDPTVEREEGVLGIYKIAQDALQDSTLWLATGPAGLVRFNSSTGVYTIPDQSAVADPPKGVIFTTLLPTKEKIYLGNMWSKRSFVYDLATRSFRELKNTNPSINGELVKLSLIIYRSPTTFWARDDSGFFIYNIEKDSLLQRFPKTENGKLILNGILATPDGLWVGSEKGLLFYDFSIYKIENHIFKQDETRRPSFVTSILEKEDSSGFWVAFQESGYVYDYDRKSRTFQVLTVEKKGLRTPSQLIRLHNGQILAIAGDGFHELRGNRLVYLPKFEKLVATNVGLAHPYQDSQGFLWTGSDWGGLYKMDLENEQYRDYVAGMGFNGIPSLFMDREDNIWMGNRGGCGFLVYHAQRDTIFQFPCQPGTKKTIYYPRGFEQDRAGYVWMSDTRAGGLMKVDPNDLEKGILERYTSTGGAFNNFMYSLKSDEKGRIWAVTKEGLQVFDPQKGTFKLFGQSVGFRVRDKSGMYSNLFPSFLERLSTSEMLAGYRDGFAIFHPDSLLAIKNTPRPYLLSLNVNKKSIKGITLNGVGETLLKHNENSPLFEYSAISRHGWGPGYFTYRLRGLEDGWVETEQQSVRFAQLPSGRYTFELYAVSGSGEKFGEPLEVRFEILPPWWATWWAYTGYFLLTLFLASAFYHYKKRQWQLQSQLDLEHLEAERLKELVTVKTNLYTNITHEFRTPLTIILGMAKQIRTNPKDWYSEGLQMIERNGKNLLRLVNQMLDLSKLEAGAMPVHPVQGDVVAFLKYIFESFYSLAVAKHVSLQFHTDQNEIIMDYDPEKLREIVSNLVSNAIKFTREGGQVELEIGNWEIGKLEISVSDTGRGIPPEKLPHIFDRFYQVEEESAVSSSRTNNTGGTGIGLALTKELVKLLGGEISVKSQVGKGTSFEVRLPVSNRAALKERVSSLPFPPPFAGHEYGFPLHEKTKGGSLNHSTIQPSNHLLIVEDNPDVVRYLQSFLLENYRIEVAVNGRLGIEKAIKAIPDIIISDVMMPEVDGFELCETLKKDERTSHIPIILLTAKADALSRIEGLECGADAYLAKPFDKEELLVRIKKLIELRKCLQERYAQLAVGQKLEDGKFDMEEAFMIKVRGILEDHLDDETFGILNLCQELGMSRAQLYRKFKALTDQPVGYYFRSIRLHKAKELLLTTDLHISEIAYEVGFKDPAYFTRSFKEEHGINPSEVRK